MEPSQKDAVQSIRIESKADKTVVIPQDNLVNNISIELCTILDSLINSGQLSIQLDLSNVNQIDAVAISGIALLHQILTQKGTLRFSHMNKTIEKTLFIFFKDCFNEKN